MAKATFAMPGPAAQPFALRIGPAADPVRVVRLAVRGGAAGRGQATILFVELPQGVELSLDAGEEGCERPGPGGAVRPFPDPGLTPPERPSRGSELGSDLDSPDDEDAVLDRIISRIADEAEHRAQFCQWCLPRLSNGAAFCNDVCRDQYARHLMPPPGDQRGSPRGISRPPSIGTQQARREAYRLAMAKRKAGAA